MPSVFYNVSQLLRESTGATRTDRLDQAIALPLDGEPAARVIGSVELIRTPAGVLVRATLQADVPLQCSRCLGPADTPLDLAIAEEFFPTVDPVTGGRAADPDEPEAFRIDEWHHLDLTDAVRQAAVLAAPMQPLCRDDCRGLCPECGADRNTGLCRCTVAPVDSRWGALDGLRVDDGA